MDVQELSADGGTVVYQRRRGLYVWTAKTGKSLLATPGWTFYAAPNSDGRFVTLADNDERLTQFDLVNHSQIPLAPERRADEQYAFVQSSDGRYTAYSPLGDGLPSIEMFDSQTGQQTALVSAEQTRCLDPEIVWESSLQAMAMDASGERLAYWSCSLDVDDGNGSRLYVWDKGSGLRALPVSHSAHTWIRQMFVSDDGSTAYYEEEDTIRDTYAWMRADLNTGESTVLRLPVKTSKRAVNASFSGDGNWMVFAVDKNEKDKRRLSRFNLYRWNISSGALTTLYRAHTEEGHVINAYPDGVSDSGDKVLIHAQGWDELPNAVKSQLLLWRS